jgi:hypothetical protein
MNFTIIKLTTITTATGESYSAELRLNPTPANENSGVITLFQSTPFTGFAVGKTVPVSVGSVNA